MIQTLQEAVPLLTAQDDLVLGLPIAAVLAQRFRVEVLEEPIPDPSVTLRPKHGVRARLHARK